LLITTYPKNDGLLMHYQHVITNFISCDHPNKPNSTCPIWLVHVGLPDITCGALGTFSKHFSGAQFLRNPTLQKGDIQIAMITKKQKQ